MNQSIWLFRVLSFCLLEDVLLPDDGGSEDDLDSDE